MTTRYPKGPLDPWTRDLPTPPAFRPERLTHRIARELAAACPTGTIELDRGDLIVDLARCTACGLCLEAGGEAVTPSGEFLLAGLDRAAYVKRVPILGGGEARDGV